MKSFAENLRGKEVHLRLVSNDLLESGKKSVTAVGLVNGAGIEAALKGFSIERKDYGEYPPQSLLGKLLERLAGGEPAAKEEPGVCVVVEEKHGSVSADDARYIEWLSRAKGERPLVLLVPESGHAHDEAEPSPRHLLDRSQEKRLHSFWKRQWRRLKALPAPVTSDAAIAAVPRTAIPVAFTLLLAYLKRGELEPGRVAGYIGLAFGFAVGFALFNQTVLNFITFWSEFTRDAFEPPLRTLRRRVASGALTHGAVSFLSFISARGDVLIAAPLLGIGCSYLARLVLGPVGETVSVLTLRGFLMVLGNVVLGSIAGGPYPQVVAHLRAVGKISNRTSMYLGILDTVKMELGRVADFGMQTLYNAIQAVLAVVFWILLLVVDRCFLKPDGRRLERAGDVEAARKLFRELRVRERAAA